MNNSYTLIKTVVRKIIREGYSADDTYICFDGTEVPFGSDECLADMYRRKSDAERIRNSCPTKTDKRDYYNGVLKVLRREIRKAEKVNGEMNAIDYTP